MDVRRCGFVLFLLVFAPRVLSYPVLMIGVLLNQTQPELQVGDLVVLSSHTQLKSQVCDLAVL